MATTADSTSTSPPVAPAPTAPGPAAAATHATGGKASGGLQVPRPGGVCRVCGRPILQGEKFMAAVRETAIGLERLDVAPEHWASFDKAGLLGYWQTVMPRADEKKKVFVDDEVLCNLFERLAEATEPAKLHFRFVLGLILMRKRLIIYESTRHEAGGPAADGQLFPGRDIWVVRMKGRDDHLDLIDPKLDEAQTFEVSQQLGQVLNEEL